MLTNKVAYLFFHIREKKKLQFIDLMKMNINE